MSIRCFLVERTGRSWRWLRRYSHTEAKCGARSFHDATVFIDVADTPDHDGSLAWPADDPRWPTVCANCGYAFTDQDDRQLFTLEIYRRVVGTPGEYAIHPTPPAPAPTVPVGAMWFADWCLPWFSGPDGHCLVVRCQGNHDWTVDGRASNCTEACVNCGRPYHAHFDANGYSADGCDGGYQPRDSGAHRCWVRHGTPPDVTVDKNGLTCNAGGGSIQVPGWHGFLRNGELVE